MTTQTQDAVAESPPATKLTPKAKEIIAAYRRRRDEINRAAA